MKISLWLLKEAFKCGFVVLSDAFISCHPIVALLNHTELATCFPWNTFWP